LVNVFKYCFKYLFSALGLLARMNWWTRFCQCCLSKDIEH